MKSFLFIFDYSSHSFIHLFPNIQVPTWGPGIGLQAEQPLWEKNASDFHHSAKPIKSANFKAALHFTV